MNEGDTYTTEKELHNGDWITVEMEVINVKKADGAVTTKSAMTEESRKQVQERLEEIGEPEF